ncbi:MAG: prolyl oligopeptidase family serine peptidase [Chitinophagales bacterium]|nr:prolyl oligopeptidase family serine peptidase [Chitinophagales bacterium]
MILLLRKLLIAFLYFLGIGITGANAFTVNQLQSLYQDGQVFLTWKSPDKTNLRYNVYRSSTPINTKNDLKHSQYIGDVRDSSSRNVRLSSVKGKTVFIKLKADAAPLKSNNGLYVITCTSSGSFYYAVTVITLSDNFEDKTINPGSNSLSVGVMEMVADPQPIYQDSAIWKTGDVAKYYAQFATNQNTPHYPAMCNQGSYVYNFYVIKRGNFIHQPLFVFYEGLLENSIKGNGLGQFENKTITNCTIMGCDDWLPGPDNGTGPQSGDKTFWIGYHENFDMYTDSNPTSKTGTIRTYTQTRLIHTILWADKYLSVDSNKVYLVGVSAGGFGVLITANIIPDKIAAVYAVVPPVHGGTSTDEDTQLYGTAEANLPTDVLNPDTGDSIRIWDLMELRHMVDVNKRRGLPILFTVHGKNDETITWTTKPSFYDSLKVSHQGTTFFWDQRDHDGKGANFLDNETTPAFYLYNSTKSFPVFSNCSINQNPGSGDPANGDPYGAINGYLDFDSSIVDQPCTWSGRIFLKKMYVNGVVQPAYKNCTADITLRRLQYFVPIEGSTVKWSNYNSVNKRVQHGSLVYAGGAITITGIKITDAGNKIEFDISNCSRNSEPKRSVNLKDYNTPSNLIGENTSSFYIIPIITGAVIRFNISDADNLEFRMYDVMGTLLWNKSLYVVPGKGELTLPRPGSGMYFIEIKGTSIALVQKVIF